MEALASIFTGKGGTAKLGIAGIVGIVLLNMLLEYGYEAEGTTSKGAHLAVKPVKRSNEENAEKQITEKETIEKVEGSDTEEAK